MGLLKVLLVVFLISWITPVFCQESLRKNNAVLYDPLFWKDDLKLSNIQCQRIRDINAEFFQQVITLTKIENRSAVSQKTAKLLSDRSEKIWNTFQPRQKKRWKKLWEIES
ncbi:MAG TPA: hypothetical protein VD884_14135 [Ohtaekwangia sp.]|nr:hypothetical protein [Ohtaekwangia sp.]